MNNNVSLEMQSFLKLLLCKRKILLILILVTAIVSTIVSFIIPSKYKTIAVVYPIHLVPYSEESPTEQLLQYYNSTVVRDVVIKKMKLIQHYRIDTTKPDYRSLLNYLYKQNIKFSPTLYESIEIEVKDKDPKMTKAIADCIIQTADSFILTLKKRQIIEEYNNYQKEINSIQKRIDSLNNLIISIKNQWNILDANYQAKYLSKKISNGKLDIEGQKIAEAIKNKKEYIEVIQKMIKVNIVSLSKIKKEADRLKVDVNGQLSFSQVISPPYVPDKRYFPVRWLIVVLSEMAVITLFIIYLILTNKTKNQ